MPFAVGEVTLSQDEPLFVDLTMFPELPTATNIPEDEGVEELSEESSEDEVVLSVLAVLLSLDDEHEEISTVMLTKRINQDNIFFISFFIENVEVV